MIGSLNDITRSLLTHASVPHSYWVDVVHTITYLYNILPTKTLLLDTPTHVLYGRIPTYDHLRVFGCTCYVLLAPRERTKLTAQSVECVFLGLSVL